MKDKNPVSSVQRIMTPSLDRATLNRYPKLRNEG